MARSPRIGIALAFLCLVLLGAMPVLSNARPAGFDGLTFAIWLTVWQLVSAMPLLFTEMATGAGSGTVRAGFRGRTGAVALATGAMFGLSTYMYVVAAEKAGPVSMIIALQAYPLFAMLWEALFQGKRKSGTEILFTLLMLCSLVYLVTEGTFRVAGISWWIVFALGIPLLWSIAHILLKRVLETTPVTPNQVTVSRLVISGVSLLVLYVVFGTEGSLMAGLSDPAFQQAAMVMGLAYYLELVLWFHAMRHIDVSLASTVTVPAPAVTMLISIVVLGESVETYQVAAMAVIAVSLYGMLLSGKRRPRVASGT